MKKKNKLLKILLVVLLVITLTGCTQTLKDKDGKIVKNEETGQSITENIVCKPTDKETQKLYEENKVNIKDLPECNKMKISGEYEGLWNSFFVRPLAFIIIKIGSLVGSTAVSIIIITLLIRFALFPMTRKTVLQSENMKKAQPEIQRIEKKYEGKTDNESMTKKGQEMMTVYKKYEIKPLSGCLFAFIQLPIFFALLEAIYRVPVFFEKKFLVYNLGMTPAEGLLAHNYWYIILVVLIIATTYFSFKNMNTNTVDEMQAKQMKMMSTFMVVFISIISFSLPTSIALYWIVSNAFTIVQNMILKKGK